MLLHITYIILILDFLKDDYFSYLNQYARIETNYDMGSFDFEVDGNEGIINFYPTNYEFNDYDVDVLIRYATNKDEIKRLVSDLSSE